MTALSQTPAMGKTIVLAAGGTGGHVFPAEALARTLIARGWTAHLVTDGRGKGFGDRLPDVTVHRVPGAAVMGGSLLARLGAVVALAVGVWRAKGILRRLRPAVVVGFGGYPSVPGGFAAASVGAPLILHEQNAVLGRANRLLAGRAACVAASFADTDKIPAGAAVERVGNPVRATILALAERIYDAPVGDGPIQLLITGGSQGAKAFSDVIPAALAALPAEQRARLRVTQQCRAEDLERVRAVYAESGITAELKSFFDDMPARLAAAHLAIGRAGAGTTAEFCVAGVPALLVPYPYAADDHQTANARRVEQAGGAWVMSQTEFQAPALTRRLANLFAEPERLARASTAARSLAPVDAAQRLADLVERFAAGAAR